MDWNHTCCIRKATDIMDDPTHTTSSPLLPSGKGTKALRPSLPDSSVLHEALISTSLKTSGMRWNTDCTQDLLTNTSVQPHSKIPTATFRIYSAKLSQKHGKGKNIINVIGLVSANFWPNGAVLNTGTFLHKGSGFACHPWT